MSRARGILNYTITLEIFYDINSHHIFVVVIITSNIVIAYVKFIDLSQLSNPQIPTSKHNTLLTWPASTPAVPNKAFC